MKKKPFISIETASFYKTNGAGYAYDDLADYVSEIGKLLSRTSTQVKACELVDDGKCDTVNIIYRNDYKKQISIECCSWKAIMEWIARNA